MKETSFNAACGGALINWSDDLFFFCYNLGFCSVTQAELCAIKVDLNIGAERAFTNLDVESNLMTFINLIKLG